MPRHRHDPLTPSAHPHWLVVSESHGHQISIDALPAWADLRHALQVALTTCAQEGWRVDSDGAHGFVFIAKGAERRLLNLTPADPAANFGQGHSVLAGFGSRTLPVR